MKPSTRSPKPSQAQQPMPAAQPPTLRRHCRPRARGLLIASALAAALLAVTSCGDDSSDTTGEDTADKADAGADEGSETAPDDGDDEAGEGGGTVTVIAHDSFTISEESLAAFATETGIDVEILSSGDTGTMVAEAILVAGNPIADVMFGIDNTFLQRGLDADLFEPYRSPRLGDLIDGLAIDPEHRVTPIDYGDVCVNYWIDALPADPPQSLEDLTDPAFADQLVVQSPETSSPGLAFLLATIAGTDDWESYWADLVANGVSVTAGWEDAYYTEFTAGGGDRSLVVSYASSPPAEVIYADPPVDTAPTGILADSCFRQIEFAGVLRGAANPEGARRFIDFLLSERFQEEIPLSMFVFPALASAELPPEFAEHAVLTDNPLTMAHEVIEENRNAWVDRWVEIVLG